MLQNPIMICISPQLMEWNGMQPRTVMVLRLSNVMAIANDQTNMFFSMKTATSD